MVKIMATLEKKKTKRKPTLNQRAVFDKVKEQVAKGGKVSVSKAMRDVGYAPVAARHPAIITHSKVWEEMLENELSDSKAAEVHAVLLNSAKFKFQIFPDGPRNEKEKPIFIAEKLKRMRSKNAVFDVVTDDEIKEMMAFAQCKVLKILHQYKEKNRKVFFIAPDLEYMDLGLDKLYKLKGKYAKEKESPNVQTVVITQVIIKKPDGSEIKYESNSGKTVGDITDTKTS